MNLIRDIILISLVRLLNLRNLPIWNFGIEQKTHLPNKKTRFPKANKI